RPGRRGHWHEPGRWYPHPLDRRPDLADHPGGRGRGAAGRRRRHRGGDALAGQARNPGGALGRRRRCGPAGGQADSRRTHGADPEWRQCGPGSLHPTGARMTLLNPRLLLVTEDPALARTLSWVLKENGYDIVTAVGTVQLHERLEQEIYDLLVIDVGDGDAGAMTRLAASREHPGHRDTPLLVLADRQFLAAALDQFGLTAADLVQRPYRVRELLSRIKAHLRVGRELNRARAEARSRSELVEILKEVNTARDPEEIYQILVRRVATGLRIARCSVVLATADD